MKDETSTLTIIRRFSAWPFVIVGATILTFGLWLGGMMDEVRGPVGRVKR